MNQTLQIDAIRRQAWLIADDQVLLRDCEVDTYRSHGPGGQKRNKTDSAVRVRHLPTGLIVIAPESRSQHENRARGLRRIRFTIALHARSPVETDPFEPSKSLAECLTKARILIGKKDQRYPLIVAEILDLLDACDAQLSTTAAHLGITTGNLASFINNDPKLADGVNHMREKRGLKRIK
jgi:hypothetical protein